MPDPASSLHRRLKKTPFLLVDPVNHAAMLVSKGGIAEAVASRTHVVMDALSAFDGLEHLAKGQQEFSLTEIAKVAGVDYPTAYFWMREGIVVPSLRAAGGAGKGRGPLFSFTDAFGAGIAGTLRRLGFGHEILRLIPIMFEERTSDRAVTRSRS